MDKEKESLKTEKRENKDCIMTNSKLVYGIAIGVVIGIVIMVVLNLLNITGNSRVAKIDGKSLTEKTIFSKMKKYYALSFILEEADKTVLNDIYQLTEEQMNEINDEANYYFTTYQTYYGYTEEKFLQENGFSSKDEFIDVLRLNYLRNLYYVDYLGTLLPQEDITNYYDNNVYGKIDSKHILIKTSEDVTEEEALKKANAIIQQLNNGKTFEEVVEEYSDDIIFEELGPNGFDSEIEEPYMKALRELEDGAYTTEPVKTSYGYHIIYRISQMDKPTLEESRRDIVKILAEDMTSGDETLYDKSLLNLREKYNFQITDEVIREAYKTYCDEINAEKTEEQ